MIGTETDTDVVDANAETVGQRAERRRTDDTQREWQLVPANANDMDDLDDDAHNKSTSDDISTDDEVVLLFGDDTV